MEEEKRIIVYTDGSSLSNGGDNCGCGWACKLSYAEKAIVKAGNDFGKTNNQMEITAIIKAMQSIRNKTIPVELYSDSEYAIKILNGEYKAKKNLDLWSTAQAERDKFSCIKFFWVKGHAEDQNNIEVDRAARQEAEKAEVRLH